MTDNPGIHPDDRFPLVNGFIFFAALVITGLAPFFKGLFFHNDQWYFLCFTAVLFIAAVLFSPSGRMSIDLMDLLMLAMPLAYLASCLDAASYSLAIGETLKYCAWFMAYYLFSRLAKRQRDFDALLAVLFLSGLGVAVACIPLALGVINYTGGYTGLFTSFFQYKNTLAAFLGSVLFIGIYFRKQAGKNGWLITLANFTILFAMRGTSSRGGILAFCLVFCFMAYINRRRCDLSCLYLLWLAVWTLFSAPLFIGLVNLQFRLEALAAYLLPAAAAALGEYIMFKKGVYTAARLRLVKAVSLLLALLIAGLLLAGTIYDASYLTGPIETETGIQTGGGANPVNFWYRLYYDLDALEAASDRPVLGWGGGGWQTVYRSYQDFLYNTRKIHNHFLEVLVEAGLVGLVVFTCIWLVFIIRSLSIILKDHREGPVSQTALAVFPAGMTLGVHALMDFTLSFLAVLVFAAAFFAVTRNICHVRKVESRLTGVPLKAVLIAGAALVLVTSINQIRALDLIDRAGEFMGSSRPASARVLFEKALNLNYRNSGYHILYARCLLDLGDKEGAFKQAQLAVVMAPFYSLAYYDAADISLKAGQDDSAVYYSSMAVRRAPFHFLYYSRLARSCYLAGVNRLKEGDWRGAGRYFRQGAGVTGDLDRLIAGMPPRKKEMWVSPPPLQTPPQVLLYSGVCSYLAEDKTRGEGMIRESAVYDATAVDANLWLAVISQDRGEDGGRYLGRALELDHRVGPLYEILREIVKESAGLEGTR